MLGVVVACVLGVVLLAGCRGSSAADVDTPETFPEGRESTKLTTTAKAATPKNTSDAKPVVTHKATIKTVKGDIVVELYGKDAPKTVENFVKLANKKFYDGLNFHRVETGAGFQLIQGGDPNGDGSGGPGWSVDLEISPKLRHVEGALAMARSQDPNSAGSQFYITLCPIAQLDDQYAVFGKVISGLDNAKKIAVGDKMTKVTVTPVK
jgi:cyclophilin family peptidyl-prolyl cis-trans isomerase